MDKVEKYKSLLKNLLPPGRLYDLINMPVLDALIEATAQEFVRIDARISDALTEIDPRNTLELLEDWERLLGLPDECSPLGATEIERRQQIVQKYTAIGGLSAAYYEFITEQLGYPSTVWNWLPFEVGRSTVGEALTNDFEIPFQVGQSQVGDSLVNYGWKYYFNVEMPATATVTFDVGRSKVGDPLREFSNELIECTIKKLKPAHAGVTFTFKE